MRVCECGNAVGGVYLHCSTCDVVICKACDRANPRSHAHTYEERQAIIAGRV